MKKLLIFSFLLALVIPAFAQQVTPETLIKRQKRKGLTIKEWNTQVGAKQAFLDHVTTLVPSCKHTPLYIKSSLVKVYSAPANFSFSVFLPVIDGIANIS